MTGSVALADQGRDNNFNLLRMILASAVLVSHAWPIAAHGPVAEPLRAGLGYSLGTLSVAGFFVISGYFITKSYLRRASLGDFVLARALRIYPALVVVLVLSVLVFGVVGNDRPAAAYFAQARTWRYVMANLTLIKHQYDLPGALAGLGSYRAINGSIWSLRPEVECYALVALIGLLRAPRIAAGTVLIALLVLALRHHGDDGSLLRSAAVLSLPFALGACVCVFADRVPLAWWIVPVPVALAWLLRSGDGYYPLLALAIGTGLIWLGFARIAALAWYQRLGDYSYGLYLYAWPVEMIVAQLAPGIAPGWLIVAAWPVTLVCAVVSWHAIERPMLHARPAIMQRLRALAGQPGAATGTA